jgi:hypothetical protein
LDGVVADGKPGNRLAIHTSVYPAARPFLAAWYRSVAVQADDRYDLWISLDGITRGDAIRAMGAEPTAEWLDVVPGTRPSAIRQQAIEQLAEHYAMVALVDCDDVLYPSRVGTAITALRDHDVAACAMTIVNVDAQEIGVTFGPPAGVDAVSLLSRYNVFGLSNSAYRTELLMRCLPLPVDCVAFDWLIAARARVLDGRLWFDRTPHMAYRQYGGNTAKVLPPFTADVVRGATARVLEHHRFMVSASWPLPAAIRRDTERELARVERFAAAIDSPARLDNYLAALNRLATWYVWWWSVAHPDLEELWNR